ncbi:alpha-latroinsectotoxin-Lt1a-like [Ruditapes philippinarum]|uniref:alpha-latroinsectotoxin-Lt1a-like n=1 Tax=Ruditapes philippinarum TaxID=129788 RepID=UPI00295A5CDD|nr:alpha-latroinsectotoxin-Lt1a-like [Ruditapes philippinarum]
MGREQNKQSSKRLHRGTKIVPEVVSERRSLINRQSLTRLLQMSMISNELTRLQIYQGDQCILAENWRELYDIVSDLHYSAFYGDLVSVKRIVKERRGKSDSTVEVDIPTEDGPKLLKELTPNIGENYGKENYAGFFLKTTPLMMAAQQGRLSVVKYLVEYCKADVNANDSLGLTPLSLACSFNRLEVAKYLLTKHALINVTENRNGMTPIILASVNNHSDMCRVLLGRHAKVNIVDKFGRQAIHYAAWNYNKKAVTALYHHDNRSINVQDNDRNTPLHLLVSDENVDVELNSFTAKTDQHLLSATAQLAEYDATTADIKRETIAELIESGSNTNA